MREIRYLDKLIDELAKGRAMEKILRQWPPCDSQRSRHTPHSVADPLRAPARPLRHVGTRSRYPTQVANENNWIQRA
jgi:hypothetical protein